jgi:hypothetical protein
MAQTSRSRFHARLPSVFPVRMRSLARRRSGFTGRRRHQLLLGLRSRRRLRRLCGPARSRMPRGVPGQGCEMCQFQRAKDTCVFSWTQVCSGSDVGGAPSGCGTRWMGVCTGGAGSPCILPVPAGTCSRFICASSSML